MIDQKYAYSIDGENFNFLSIGELIDSLNDDDDVPEGREYYRAEIVPPQPASSYFCVESFLQDVQERAEDAGGEHAENFTAISKEQRDEINRFVSAWLDKNLSVTFFCIKNVTELHLTSADLESS